MFADVLRVMLDFGLAFPPHIAGALRALVTLDGTLRILDPDVDIVAHAASATADLGEVGLRPDAVIDAITHDAIALLPILRWLPRRIDRIAHAAERGELTVNVRLFADDRDAGTVNAIVNRTLLAVLAPALGALSVQLLDQASGAALHPLELVGVVALVLSGVLTLRILIQILRPHMTAPALARGAHATAGADPGG